MKRLPFEPPTEHYDEKIKEIDEEIVQLMMQRKDVSNNNPGFPRKELIADWAKKYDFYEDFLNSVFSNFLHEEIFKPIVEPEGFIKNIPVLRSFEKDNEFYSITFMGQFENASVIHFNVDKEDPDLEISIQLRAREHTYFDLSIVADGVDYECRNQRGGGSGGHNSYTYIVTPALLRIFQRSNLLSLNIKYHIRNQLGLSLFFRNDFHLEDPKYGIINEICLTYLHYCKNEV